LKAYTSYTKAEPPFFNLSEFLTLPVLPLTAVAVVSYPILYFLGLVPMLVVNVLIAFVATGIYHGFKNATPNGAHSRSRAVPGYIVMLSLLPTFLVILGAELTVNAGMYILVTYQKTGVFYGWYFCAWMFVVFGIPGLYFFAQHLSYRRLLYFQARHFRPLSLSIIWDAELQIYMEEIVFLNTERKLLGNAFVNDRPAMRRAATRIMSLKERNAYLYNTVFATTVHIPKDADRLRISWYSVTEDCWYQEEIGFPFQKLVYIENNYPLDQSKLLRGERTDPVTLSLGEGGRVHLYNREYAVIEPVYLKPVPADEAKKKALLGFTMYEWLQDNTEKLEDSRVLLERVRQRSLLSDFACRWQVTGSGLEEHVLTAYDVRGGTDNGREAGFHILEMRFLPLMLEFSYACYRWARLHIDAEKLCGLLQTTGCAGADISFEINLDVEKGDVSFSVKCSGVVLPFTAFEKEIVSDSLSVVKKKIRKAKEKNTKNELLKRVYELIQQKAFAEAQELCRTTLEQYPEFALMYFYEARLLWYTQGYDASYAREEFFVEKTKGDPYALARIYNHYGCLLDEEKRYQEALTCFEKASATYPDEIMYKANIAEIYYKLNDPGQALRYADECVSKGYASDMISEIMALRSKKNEKAV